MESIAIIAGIVLFPLALYVLYHSTPTGIFLVLLVFVARAMETGEDVFADNQINISPYDVVFAVLALAAVFRILTRMTVNVLELLWIILGLVVIVAFVRGMYSYGILQAGEIRPFFYFVTAVLYSITAPLDRNQMNSVAKLWMIAAVAISVIAIVNLASGRLVSDSATAGALVSRPLHAFYALLVFQGCLISFLLWQVPGSALHWRILGPMMLPVVILLQYRTVWVVAVFTVLLAVLRARRIESRIIGVGVTATMFCGIILLTFLAGVVDQNSSQALTEPFSGYDSSIGWRIDGWLRIMKDVIGLNLDFLIGSAAGTARTLIETNFIFAHSHNQYLDVMLRTGIAGLSILFFSYKFALRNLKITPSPERGEMLSEKGLYFLLAGQLVFYITYTASYEQFLLLGITIGWLTHRRVGATPTDVFVRRTSAAYAQADSV